MKLWYTLILSLLFSHQSWSQAVERGNFEIMAGVGFGVYGATNNDTASETSLAVPGLIPISVNYALTNRLSLGLQFERNGFLTDQDSSEAARSTNFGLRAAFRMVNTASTTLYLHALLTSSAFTYEDLAKNVEVSSDGSALQVGLGFQHYFSAHLGIFSELSVASYNYDQFKDDADRVLKTANGLEDLDLDLVGANLRFGINLKF